MPVLPDVESISVFSGVSAPRLSPSSIIDSAARSLTEPPGLNHSAFAYTSTLGNSLSNMRMRKSGVLPISLVISAARVVCAIFKRIESRSAGEVDQDGPSHDIEACEGVSDDRAPVHRSALGRQDVDDRLPDQVARAEQRDDRRARQHSIHEDRAGGPPLEKLQRDRKSVV